MSATNIGRNRTGITTGLFLFFIFMIFRIDALAGDRLPKDSARNKYDLNDPRNPDCPCHKYQKIAEEEFKKLQMNGTASGEAEQQKENSRNRKRFFHRSGSSNGSPDRPEISSANNIHKTKRQGSHHKHRKKNKRSRLRRRIYELRHSDFWQRVSDPGACFRWN